MEDLRVFQHLRGGRGERGDDADGYARIATGREDGDVNFIAELLDAVGTLAPFAEALAPHGGLRRGIGGDVLAFLARVLFVHPGLELFRVEIGEGKEEVGDIALRIDGDDGDAVHGG